MSPRKTAMNNGERFYQGDKRCPRDHDSLRYVTTGNCVECISSFCKSEKYRTKSKEYRDSRKSTKAEYDRLFDITNRAYRNALKSSNRAKRKQRIVDWDSEFSELVLEEAYALCELRKKVIGTEWHVDHIYPLCAKHVSGLHNGYNLQVVPAKWNLAKGNRHCESYFPTR